MARATIIIEDTDLDNGIVSTSISIEGTAMDDGFVTAAQFFATHIKDCMRDPVFLAAVWANAEALMATNPNATIKNAELRIVAHNDRADTKAA